MTEVAAFGAGFVDFLNAAPPPGTPPAAPVGDLGLMAAGDTLELGTHPAGTYLFESLIHPWMRATVTQR